MDYEIVTIKEKIAVGVSARTKNAASDMEKVIGRLWSRFYQEGIYASIPGKVNEKSLGIYTDYAGDEKADYTVLAACETKEQPRDKKYAVCRIPGGSYAKFIVRGDMVQAVAEAWQQIWQMNLPRAFQCDFEEYQNEDMENAEIHIYVGLKPSDGDKAEGTAVIESRCGIVCSACSYREEKGCTGCIHMEKPFWGSNCSLKDCCEKRQLEHCGQCREFPCDLLRQFAYDEKLGDNGKRLEQCRKWGDIENGVKD